MIYFRCLICIRGYIVFQNPFRGWQAKQLEDHRSRQNIGLLRGDLTLFMHLNISTLWLGLSEKGIGEGTMWATLFFNKMKILCLDLLFLFIIIIWKDIVTIWAPFFAYMVLYKIMLSHKLTIWISYTVQPGWWY